MWEMEFSFPPFNPPPFFQSELDLVWLLAVTCWAHIRYVSVTGEWGISLRPRKRNQNESLAIKNINIGTVWVQTVTDWKAQLPPIVCVSRNIINPSCENQYFSWQSGKRRAREREGFCLRLQVWGLGETLLPPLFFFFLFSCRKQIKRNRRQKTPTT